MELIREHPCGLKEDSGSQTIPYIYQESCSVELQYFFKIEMLQLKKQTFLYI